MINTFFDATVEAIQKEETELNQLFSSNSKLYKKHHQGVCNLYETTFAYLVFKELLKRQYPLMVYWEYPYPYPYFSNKREHCDLALLNEFGKPTSLIEFKIWIKDDDIGIKADALKLQKVSECNKYIVIIGYGGDIEENHKYLIRDNILKLVNKKGLSTKYFKTKSGKVEDNELNVFMYEVV